MQALVYHGPQQLVLEEVPAPTARDEEVVVDIRYVGICGSDMHAYLGHDDRRPAPLILGHEAAGETTAEHYPRVTINPLVTCQQCEYCQQGRENLCQQRQIISMPPREGAFAEQVAVPERNLVAVPETFTLAKAALCEPVACGWHAVSLVQRYLASTDKQLDNANVLVFGGGSIGVGSVLSLMARGVEAITLVEANSIRRSFLYDATGIQAIAPDELPETVQFDAVIDGVGIAATRASASALVKAGGVIIHIGLGSSEGGLDIRRLTLQEIAVIGSYTYTAQDFRDTAQAMFSGKMGNLDWVDIRPLAEGAQAFADIYSGKCAAPKVILQP